MDAAGEITSLEMAGLPISRWFKEQEYGTDSGQIEPGGRLVLFSDGLEAQWHGSGAPGDLYGSVGRILCESAAEDCLDEIWRTAGAGETEERRGDDTTMLMIGRLAAGGNGVQAC